LKKPGTIRVVIGPAIDAAGRDARELNEEVRAWIEKKLATLTPDGESGLSDPSGRPVTTG
jgi:1-acyl-sn-glycerol-3-phosphate acyltransferase